MTKLLLWKHLFGNIVSFPETKYVSVFFFGNVLFALEMFPRLRGKETMLTSFQGCTHCISQIEQAQMFPGSETFFPLPGAPMKHSGKQCFRNIMTPRLRGP